MSMACPEDMLCRRRSGRLSETEAASLDAHLAGCPACAVEAGVHEAFERAGRARPDDPVLITAAVDRALRPGALRRLGNRRSRPGLAIAVGAAVVIVAGFASAGWWSYRTSLRKRAVAPQPARATEVSPATARTESACEVTLPTTSVADGVAPSAQAQSSAGAGEVVTPPTPRERSSRTRSKVASAHASSPPAVAALAPVSDLKALFASASEARKAGDHGRAAGLYDEIERRFPDSREARLSFVAFGRMLLDRGEHARALAQFERYLSVAPSDVLAAEACYGRARALVGLGRASDARRAWAELLSQFPDSIYADVARKQLGQSKTAK